jgi:hypothetical protein
MIDSHLPDPRVSPNSLTLRIPHPIVPAFLARRTCLSRPISRRKFREDVFRVAAQFQDVPLSDRHAACPKGVGALYIRQGVHLSPIVFGGGQERGLRSATENVAGFVGFGAAADIARKELAEETPCLKQFREHISRSSAAPCLIPNILGHSTRRLPGHLSIGVRGQEREVGKLLAVLNAAAFPSRLAAPVAPTIPGNLPASSWPWDSTMNARGDCCASACDASTHSRKSSVS